MHRMWRRGFGLKAEAVLEKRSCSLLRRVAILSCRFPSSGYFKRMRKKPHALYKAIFLREKIIYLTILLFFESKIIEKNIIRKTLGAVGYYLPIFGFT